MSYRAATESSEINRRSFLQTSALATVASSVAVPAVHAASKTGKNPVIGEGEFQYECIHDWGLGNLPAGAHYGGASHGVAVDSQGLVYLTHFGDPGSIFVFDPDARFVRSMGDFHQVSPAESDGKKTARGHGIDIRTEGSSEFIYVSPSDPSMDFLKMDLSGEVVWRKDRESIHQDSDRYPEGTAFIPTNTSFSPNGGYFLGDGYGSSLVHQFDAQDNYLRTIGTKGKGEGQFDTPHGQWLDERDGTPKLVVADRANKRLQWFDMEGNYLKQLGGFLFPADIDIRGDILMVPDLHCRITLLDKNDEVIVHLGEDPEWRVKALEGFKMRGQRDQWQPGKFIHPHDACFDANGNIFVTEWVDTGRVTKLRKA